MPEVKLPVPIEFRRGILRGDEFASVMQGIELLGWVDGIQPLAGARILDFGCGVKIAQALCQMGNPQQFYAGVDVYAQMIDHMQTALADDPKYLFRTVPFQNDMYNPDGQPMTHDTDLPIPPGEFDILLMFLVLTHMAPHDSATVLAILRRYAAPGARLFFWANVDVAEPQDFSNDDPERPLQRAMYRKSFLEGLIQDAGWRIETVSLDLGVGNRRPHTQGHYVCIPA